MRKLILILPLLLACPAHAADKLDCRNAQTQIDMDSCAGQEFQKSDRALNANYKQLMGKLDPHAQAALKTAQHAWLAWRDAECDYRTIGSEGDTIRPMLATYCKTELTNARVKDIKDQRKCPAGDLSCPAN
jgi:uncharacterized protein YecT (DUF1311 family)